ncbi:MAG: YraN family protein [Pseudomonadota bacterium]
MNNHLEIGRKGEDLAVKYLAKRGLKVLARNYRTKYGEIDIICLDRKVVVFVEVRSRSSAAFMTPDESVGPDKRRRLTKAALSFLADKRWQDHSARFDVLAVTFSGSQPEIDHVIDAFDLAHNRA